MKVQRVHSMYFKAVFSALLLSGSLVLDSAGEKSSKCVESEDPLSITVDREFQTLDLEAKSTVHPIICTTNKPADLSVWFNEKYSYSGDIKRLQANSTGVKIITSPCRLVVNFTSKLLECHLGAYECRATNATGGRVTALSNVTYLTTNRKPEKFRFQIEDPVLRKKKELIIGTSANLSCTYRGDYWHSSSSYLVHFEYKKGVDVKETVEGLKKIRIFQTKATGGVKEKEGTFKIGLYRINYSDSHTYRCSIMLPDSESICPRFSASGFPHWISRTLTISFRPCRAGYYCSNASSVETPCPGGTYSGVTGLFDRTKCRQCPIDSYCPEASKAPIKCKKTKFKRYRWEEHPLTPAKSNDNCERCPVKPCDENARICTFICGQQEELQTDEGTPVSLVCRLSNASLLRNLTWTKGNHTVFTNDSNVASNSTDKLFRLSIAKTRLEDSGEYICSGYEKVLGTSVRAIIRLKVVKRDKPSNSLELALGITGAVVPVLIMAICFVCYRKRRRNSLHSSAHNPDFTASTGIYTETHLPEPLRQLFQRLPSQGSEVEHAFDVFICYSSSDKEWVRRTLLEKLKEYKMRVCIDFKDFTPGDFIIQNIADAIYNSRKTIAVLSPDFVVSAWCQQELQMALARIEDKHQVIPLMYRDCEVPPFLWHRTYLDWCNPDIRPMFWQQLLRAVNDGKDVNLPIEDGTFNLGSDVDSLLEEEVDKTKVTAIESFDGII